jgi:hypothetical protein
MVKISLFKITASHAGNPVKTLANDARVTGAEHMV